MIQKCGFLCALKVIITELYGYLTCQTARQRNKSAAVFFQQFKINSRLGVKSLGIRQRHHFYQILIALIVLAEQHEMIRMAVQLMNIVKACAACNIYLAADNRLYSFCKTFIIKINCSKHNAVIGDCGGSLSKLNGMVYDITDTAGSVQQTVFTVKMQMYKTAHFRYRPVLPSMRLQFPRFFSACDLLPNVPAACQAARPSL